MAKFYKPMVELIDDKPTEYETIKHAFYRHVENVGRVCYKSENRITKDSAEPFVKGLIKAGHLSMLEHGTLYLAPDYVRSLPDGGENIIYSPYTGLVDGIYVTNGRVMLEYEYDLNDALEKGCIRDPQTRRYTVRFTISRAIAQEFTRHRTMSFAMESQRYIDYTSSKTAGQIHFILPEAFEMPVVTSDGGTLIDPVFKDACGAAERAYFDLRSKGYAPQEARAVLPNATKTELIITGFDYQWKNFFKLRCSMAADPEARRAAKMAEKLLENIL